MPGSRFRKLISLRSSFQDAPLGASYDAQLRTIARRLPPMVQPASPSWLAEGVRMQLPLWVVFRIQHDRADVPGLLAQSTSG
jgi:hypothetical protein